MPNGGELTKYEGVREYFRGFRRLLGGAIECTADTAQNSNASWPRPSDWRWSPQIRIPASGWPSWSRTWSFNFKAFARPPSSNRASLVIEPDGIIFVGAVEVPWKCPTKFAPLLTHSKTTPTRTSPR